MSHLLKAVFTPGSVGFLLLSLVVWVGIRFVWPGTRGSGRVWLGLVAGMYVVLALPWVASAIAAGLRGVPPVDAGRLAAVDTLVVLDGDNRVARVAEAARLYRRGSATQVVVLGDGWIVGALEAAGIPVERTLRDGRPATTRAQIEWLKSWLAEHPDRRPALIASRLQMARVAALVSASGLTLLLVPSPIDDEPPTTGVWRFVPTYIALRVSRDALYERVALAYYRWQGWIGRS